MWLIRSTAERRRVRSSSTESARVTPTSAAMSANIAQPHAPCHSNQATPANIAANISERMLCVVSSAPAQVCPGSRSRHSWLTKVSNAPSAPCTRSRTRTTRIGSTLSMGAT
jgi:hypothetical protein